MLEKKCALLRTLVLNSADWGGTLGWARPLFLVIITMRYMVLKIFRNEKFLVHVDVGLR